MRPAMMGAILVPLMSWARTLRYPTLFKLVCALFVLSVLVPDPIPLLDEFILGLGALWLAQWKARPSKTARKPVVIDGVSGAPYVEP